MYHNVNSKDRVGTLITQLKVIKDDLEFLKATGGVVEKEHYPFLAKTANEALLNAFGDLCNKAASRVEAAGFWVWKKDGKLHFHTPHGVVSVEIEYRRKFNENKDWRDSLVSPNNATA
tara:strand:- start:1684 stop:2037 length:354 start_codon:yes stop_codon:yes gene_type:complete